jgi:hypothetical protein
MAQLGRFRNEREKDYFVARADLIAATDPNTIADAPFLFAPRQLITEVAVRYELFSLIRDASGAIVECGLDKGNSLLFSSIYPQYSSHMQSIAALSASTSSSDFAQSVAKTIQTI